MGSVPEQLYIYFTQVESEAHSVLSIHFQLHKHRTKAALLPLGVFYGLSRQNGLRSVSVCACSFGAELFALYDMETR